MYNPRWGRSEERRFRLLGGSGVQGGQTVGMWRGEKTLVRVTLLQRGSRLQSTQTGVGSNSSFG